MFPLPWADACAQHMLPGNRESGKFDQGGLRVWSLHNVVGIGVLASCGHGADGILSHSPHGHVHHMSSPVGHQTAGIIPKPTKGEVKASGIEWSLRSGTKPKIIVDTGWRLLIGRITNASLPIQIGPSPDLPDLSKLTRSHKIHSLCKVAGASLLCPYLNHPVVLASCFH